jgi:lipid-A-disaccharide synthase
VWAYRPSRAKKIAKIYDCLLALLPFEPPYFTKEGLSCIFVGHPVVEDEFGSRGDFFEKFKILDNQRLLCIMPGSRESELEKLLPIFLDTVSTLLLKIANLKIIVISLPHLAKKIEQKFNASGINILSVTLAKDKRDALAACEVALVKSGTSSLEVAYAKLPMIVAYKVNFISAFLLKMMIKIPFVSLINIILKQKIIPEFLQEECSATNLANNIDDLMNNKELRNKQIINFAHAFSQLKIPNINPSQKAADVILNLINEKNEQKTP